MENQKKEVWLRKALFLIVSLALFFPMMAQTITVKGVVKESMTGEPIIGANVAVKGTTNGTISDISGMYQISNVSSNAVLIVSYIGYKTAEIPVNGKNTINVSLEEESIGLQEVVAVGYGSQKKKELTGSVAGLKEGDLIKGVQSDPMGMLQGKVAGLNISKPNAGDPNGEYKFQYRCIEGWFSGGDIWNPWNEWRYLGYDKTRFCREDERYLQWIYVYLFHSQSIGSHGS